MAAFLKNSKAVIGMIHVAPLPGTPRFKGSFNQILDKAAEEALIYKRAGVDMLAIENMHDVPYLNREVGPEIVAGMTAVGLLVKRVSEMACGVQVLAGANKSALAVALSANLDFIRAEGFVFSHVADEGAMQSDAGELLRYRKQIGADHIPVLTDIKKKHSAHAITGDVSIEETARAAEFFLSDGVIVTGTATGAAADPAELDRVARSVAIPVIVGSGVTSDNLHQFLPVADAVIVGSWFKKNGKWNQDLDEDRVKVFMQKARALRNR